ncbi:MAG: type II toxin-antitoxin system VapC family toxin [bacterium]
MICGTDIFIWIQRGNKKAADIIDKIDRRFLSIRTYMELLQCAKNRKQHDYIKDFLSAFNFTVLPLTENIGHRALIYIEEYTLSTYLRAGDAIIASTAVENNLILFTSNIKHFKSIKDLKIKAFKP